ncbi:Secreted protein [Phytophthora palmivora]|uniref:Secreted protein n=1 Tax=Phytophthora palmivora TaxID=4796 RepID=A0A2P4XB04_9STRA|nr:Secreted protein [Phytophthora palmivora]
MFRVPVPDVDVVDPERGRNLWITAKRELVVHNHLVSPEIYRHYPVIRLVSTQPPLNPGITGWRAERIPILRHRERVVSAPKCTWGYGVISVTSQSMRAILDSSPEILQMDCTYKTNKYVECIQLLTIVAMDLFGQGQLVQYSLLETTTDKLLAKYLDHFKRADEPWQFVRIVTVCKGMCEVDVIKQELVEARVQFCHFHIKNAITNMTYSNTQDSCEMDRAEFESLSCSDDGVMKALQKKN